MASLLAAYKKPEYLIDTFYEVLRTFQVGGVAALVEQRRSTREPHPSRLTPVIEKRVPARGSRI
ncbi:MAG: hypothetical protein Q8L93_00045 [Rhodocyclaceae bacterium]|nr:hypothetical protein [Rhodocyclaceae bacterium]